MLCAVRSSSAVDTTIEEAVHAVLIAGDLFDNERLSFETEEVSPWNNCIGLDKAGIPCFYGDRQSRSVREAAPWRGKMAWPASFHLLDKRSSPTRTR